MGACWTRAPRCADCARVLYYQWYKEVPELEQFSAMRLMRQLDADGWLPGEREHGRERARASGAREANRHAELAKLQGCACKRADNGRSFKNFGACCHCQGQPPEAMCKYCRPRTFEGWVAGGRRGCCMRALKRAALSGDAGAAAGDAGAAAGDAAGDAGAAAGAE